MAEFKKTHHNHSEFARSSFSELVSVTGSGKFLFLSGIGAEVRVSGPRSIKVQRSELFSLSLRLNRCGEITLHTPDRTDSPHPSSIALADIATTPSGRSARTAQVFPSERPIRRMV